MNGTLESVKSIVDSLNKADLDPKVEQVKSKQIAIASQTVSERPNGAYTGEVSVSQVKDVGATWAIIGHSERRHVLKETSEVIADKTKYALDNGLGVILCIGELIEEKKAGKTMQVNEEQLAPVIKLVKDWSKVVIAYEPVWAIGTGLAATPEDAQEIQKALRDHLASKLGKQTAESLRILYGGSVNGKNATSFRDKPDIDGFLVGGASLKPEFIDIINSRR